MAFLYNRRILLHWCQIVRQFMLISIPFSVRDRPLYTSICIILFVFSAVDMNIESLHSANTPHTNCKFTTKRSFQHIQKPVSASIHNCWLYQHIVLFKLRRFSCIACNANCLSHSVEPWEANQWQGKHKCGDFNVISSTRLNKNFLFMDFRVCFLQRLFRLVNRILFFRILCAIFSSSGGNGEKNGNKIKHQQWIFRWNKCVVTEFVIYRSRFFSTTYKRDRNFDDGMFQVDETTQLCLSSIGWKRNIASWKHAMFFSGAYRRSFWKCVVFADRWRFSIEQRIVGISRNSMF